MQPVAVEDGAGIDVVHLAVAGPFVARTVHRQAQRLPVAPRGEHRQRVEDALDQQVVAARDQRRDHVHDLGQVGDLEHVGVAHEAVQEAGHYQRVLQVVRLLDQVRGDLALAVHLAVLVPDVPLVEAQVGALLAALPRLDVAAHRVHLLDLAVDRRAYRQVVGRVVVGVADVAVQADVVGQIAHVLQHRAVPLHVGGELHGAGAARHQLNGRVGILHHLGGLLGADGVLVGRHVAELPLAIHLVAQAPQSDVVRFGCAGRRAQVGVARAGGAVAVLDPVARLLRGAGAEVDGHHRRPVHLPAQPDELLGAESVGLDTLPGQLAHPRTLLARADAVLPVVAGGEVAARVAHGSHAQSGEGIEDVGAAAVGVGVDAVRIVDAFVHGAAHVLEKSPEHARVDPADPKVGVQRDSRSLHVPIIGTLR